jgi:hypothetical protein
MWMEDSILHAQRSMKPRAADRGALGVGGALRSVRNMATTVAQSARHMIGGNQAHMSKSVRMLESVEMGSETYVEEINAEVVPVAAAQSRNAFLAAARTRSLQVGPASHIQTIQNHISLIRRHIYLHAGMLRTGFDELQRHCGLIGPYVFHLSFIYLEYYMLSCLCLPGSLNHLRTTGKICP